MAVSEKTAKKVYERYHNACALCYRAQDLQIHHKVHRSKAVPGSDYRKWVDSEENLILLCNVCHGAQHGEHVTTLDGYSCDVCAVEWICEFSQAKEKGPRIELGPTQEAGSSEEITVRMLENTLKRQMS
jgi:hypothetical protein